MGTVTSKYLSPDLTTDFSLNYQRQNDSVGKRNFLKRSYSSMSSSALLDTYLRPTRGEHCQLEPVDDTINIPLQTGLVIKLSGREVGYSNGAINDLIGEELAPEFLNPTNVSPELHHQLSTLQAVKQGRFSTIRCQCCQSSGVAKMYCEICKFFLCEKCTDNHKSLKCFKSHKLLELEEISRNPRPIFNGQQSCPSHSGRELSEYCRKCEIPLCTDCVVVKHRDHKKDVDKFSSEADRRLEQLESGVRKLDDYSQNVEDDLADLHLKMISLQENTVKILVRTDAHFTQLQELLATKCRQIQEDVLEKHRNRLGVIQAEMNELSRLMGENKVAVKNTKKFLEFAKPLNILLFGPIYESICASTRRVLERIRLLVAGKQSCDSSQQAAYNEQSLETYFKALVSALTSIHHNV